jgi:nucleoside-diphosphate-sugar epimerase
MADAPPPAPPKRIDRRAVVAGASGLIGRVAAEHLVAAGFDVVGLARRPEPIEGARMLAVDLTDPASTDVLASLRPTHVVFAALQEGPGLLPGWFDEAVMERNGAMVRHCFAGLDTTDVEHVTLLQGTKAYGVHHPDIGPNRAPIPLRERAPRVEHPNFYWIQEDHVRARQAAEGWDLTIFRPTVVYGPAGRHNMNPLPALAAYGAVLRAAGEPLHFPGTETRRVIREAVDADLVGQAIAWAAEAGPTRRGTFNLTNGDVFTWWSVWPAIADELGMEPGEHRPMSLATDLPRRNDEWARLVAAHDLQAPPTIEDFVGANSLVYADVMLADHPADPILNSTIAVRQAGFAACTDTEDMFRALLRRLVDERVIPPVR